MKGIGNEFSKKDMKTHQGIAILFMLMLHLFCNKSVNGLYETFPVINGIPLVYYLALFGDACVPIYCFASGYGLYLSSNASSKNKMRVFKLLVNYWIVLIMFIIIALVTGNSELIGNTGKIVVNFLVLSNSYNGAWWFVQTYILLVLFSPLVIKLIKKYNFDLAVVNFRYSLLIKLHSKNISSD